MPFETYRKIEMPRLTRTRRSESRERHVADDGFVPPEFAVVPANFVPPTWSSRHERDRRPVDQEEDEEVQLRRELLAQAALRRRERAEGEERRKEEEKREQTMDAAAGRWVLQMDGRRGFTASNRPVTSPPIEITLEEEEALLGAEPDDDTASGLQEQGGRVGGNLTSASNLASPVDLTTPAGQQLIQSDSPIAAMPTARPGPSTGAIPKVPLRHPPGQMTLNRTTAWRRLESEEERESREAVEDLRRVVGEEIRVSPPKRVNESTPDSGRPPTRTFFTQTQRSGPDGLEAAPQTSDIPFREENLPEHLRLNFVPIERATNQEPMEWDEDFPTEPTTSRQPNNQTPRTRGPRQLTREDVESVVVQPRSISPPGVPIRRNQQEVIPPSRQANNRPTNQRVKLTGLRYKDLNPIPLDPELDPPPYTCFNCWERGHTIFHCPIPRQGKICLNCGRYGEEISTCPRCRDSYARTNGIVRGQRTTESNRTAPEARDRGEARESTSRPSRSLSTNRGREDSQRSRQPSRSRDRSVQWADPITTGRTESTSRRTTEGSSAGKQRRRETPYAMGGDRDHSRSSSSSPKHSSSDREESPTRGVLETVTETLRLMNEVRDLPPDIRDAILRRTFIQPSTRSSRSRSKKR